MLTNKKADAARPREKEYKLTDIPGLYLVVLPSGTKSWRTYYKENGKGQTKTFGKYPAIGIAEARKLYTKFKDEPKGSVTVQTFDEVKREWYKHKLPTLLNIKHRQQVINRINLHASPLIGHMPFNEITRSNLVTVVKSVQDKGIIETAHRVGLHLRQIFDYAVDAGIIESHPAANLSRVLHKADVKHMACVPVDKAEDLFKDIQTIEEPINRLALIFVALTFVRSNELRFMRWDEIRDERFWVIPAERMKGRKDKRKPHVVPLSDFALEILEELDQYTGGYEYVFQSPVVPNKPISENTLLDALYGLGYRYKMTVHGFRSLASTILNEQSPFAKDVIERQLAHKETDAVRAAYNRAEYLPERIKLMEWWSDVVKQHLSSP